MDTNLYDWLVRLIEEGLKHPKMSEWETTFLKDQAERIDKYNSNIKMSSKQWAVLDKMAIKIEFEERPYAEE